MSTNQDTDKQMSAIGEGPAASAYTWGSRGPCADGSLGLTVAACGAAVADVAAWRCNAFDLLNGSSMSSPSVAGGVGEFVFLLIAASSATSALVLLFLLLLLSHHATSSYFFLLFNRQPWFSPLFGNVNPTRVSKCLLSCGGRPFSPRPSLFPT